jgi:hypothetical protein
VRLATTAGLRVGEMGAVADHDRRQDQPARWSEDGATSTSSWQDHRDIGQGQALPRRRVHGRRQAAAAPLPAVRSLHSTSVRPRA